MADLEMCVGCVVCAGEHTSGTQQRVRRRISGWEMAGQKPSNLANCVVLS